MDHDPPVGVGNEAMRDARRGKIAVELDPMIARGRARRKDLDGDHPVRDLDRIERRGGADDDGVR